MVAMHGRTTTNELALALPLISFAMLVGGFYFHSGHYSSYLIPEMSATMLDGLNHNPVWVYTIGGLDYCTGLTRESLIADKAKLASHVLACCL